MFNGNKLLKFLFQLPYKKLEVANAILTLVTSTLMVLSTGDNIFSQMMFPFTLVHLIMLLLLVINWFTFKIITYIKWEEKEFTFLKLIKFIMNSIFNMEIFCFAWALFWGSVAITNVKLYFLFSLQPFVIFNLFQTMKTILLTMKAKYAQFLSTFFLLVIVILFYSGITFYFFNVNDDGSPLSIVFESSFDIIKVKHIPISITNVSKSVPITDCTGSAAENAKNMVIIAIIVGNLPLHGTKLFVSIAISRSLGESIILHPVIPTALQPKPIHMNKEI